MKLGGDFTKTDRVRANLLNLPAIDAETGCGEQRLFSLFPTVTLYVGLGNIFYTCNRSSWFPLKILNLGFRLLGR